MNIQEQLQSDLKNAMRAGDRPRVDVIRMALAALQSARLALVEAEYDKALAAAPKVLDERGQVVGKGDLKAQTEQTFANLDVALKAAGASFRDVVKMNLYVVGLKPELVPLIREVRARYVNREHPPASTLVGVSALVGADWLIEIEVVAVVTE